MTCSSYHNTALASTEFSFNAGEIVPCLSVSGAVSTPDSDVLESSPFRGSPFFHVRRVLASSAGPGGKVPFIHFFQALKGGPCLFCRSLGGFLVLVVRLWPAILRPSPKVWRVPRWWRFAAWSGASCVVGSRVSPSGALSVQEGVAMKKPRN